MANADVNQIFGELMNNPLFWALLGVVALFIIGQHYGWFNKKRPEFKGETLKEILLHDLKPRLKSQGKKGNGNRLMQNYHSFGKVRKFCEGEVKYSTRTKIHNKKTGIDETKLVDQTVKIVYMLVGGIPWLAWIPFIGKQFEPEYYVFNQEHVSRNAESKRFDVVPTCHVFPYGEIWVSDHLTQRYLTELEARRAVEFEAETNVNTLKRWIYYEDGRAGHVVFKEREAQLEREKWDKIREEAE